MFPVVFRSYAHSGFDAKNQARWIKFLQACHSCPVSHELFPLEGKVVQILFHATLLLLLKVNDSLSLKKHHRKFLDIFRVIRGLCQGLFFSKDFLNKRLRQKPLIPLKILGNFRWRSLKGDTIITFCSRCKLAWKKIQAKLLQFCRMLIT